MKYKIAIFDMDGTILNTLEDLADSTNYCLKKHNLPERTLMEIKQFVGNGIHKLIERAVPENTDEETVDIIYKEFLDYYKKHCAIKTRPYAQINDVIVKLKEQGIKTAVVSNKADMAVKSLCEEYFAGLIDYSVGDKEGQRRKPYPDSVNDVLTKFRIVREEAIYIGDSEVDLQTAINAKMDVIMVGWGFREKDYILSLGAKRVIEDPKEILEYFEIEE